VTTIELENCVLAASGRGMLIRCASFALTAGDVCVVASDSENDALSFIRSLATLSAPVSGIYRYRGEAVDFSDYRRLLPIKRRIGYIAADAALISNRTLRENLLLSRHYFENSLDVSIDARSESLCRRFAILAQLERRPSEVMPSDVHLTVAVRELSKAPEVLLLDRPEDVVGPARLEVLLSALEALVKGPTAVVMRCSQAWFVEAIGNRVIRIDGGSVIDPWN
jgi:ABC-type methionine transport system ATPase subunit